MFLFFSFPFLEYYSQDTLNFTQFGYVPNSHKTQCRMSGKLWKLAEIKMWQY